MKLFPACGALFGLLSLGLPAWADSQFTAKELAQGYRDGIVLAVPRADHLAAVDAEESRDGVHPKALYPRMKGLRALELADGESALAGVSRFKATGRYASVEPDYIKHASDIAPNDPDFGSQWGLHNDGSNGGVAGADIHAEQAWSTRTSSKSVLVAVLDTGIWLTHTDLAGNLWTNASAGVDGYSSDVHGINATVKQSTTAKGKTTLNAAAGNPMDDNGHGTHVAGIIGAIGNNKTDVSGVSWAAQIMALKFMDSTGAGSTSAELACINYAMNHGVQVVNCSFGSTGYSTAEFTALSSAQQYGMIFVVAAGNSAANDDVSPSFPADYPLDNIIAVGASDSRDRPAYFSSYGSGSVDLYAPGDSILSTYYNSNTAEAVLSGTSMATPFVTSALALLKAQYPGDSYRQSINRLLRHVDQIPAMSGKVQTGGRLNLGAALTSDPSDNAPFNNSFSSRAILTGADPSVRTNNAGAGGPLWWEWTASETGSVTLDTSGSTMTPTVTVYQGATSSDHLVTIATNGNSQRTDTIQLTFPVTAGTTYEIALSGVNGATGQAMLNIGTVPLNDAFATAQVLTGPSVQVRDTNDFATRETNEPMIGRNTGGHSLWYSWTAPKTGRVQFAVYSYDFDPDIAVYTGSALSSLNPITSSQGPSSFVGTSSAVSEVGVSINAVAGTTYSIQLDGITNFDYGTFVLTMNDSRWQATTTDSVTTSPAVGPDGTVYAGSDDETLYAYNPDGSTKWTYVTDAPLDTSSVAVGPDGTVYLGSEDGTVKALSFAGTVKWTYTVPTPTDPTLSTYITCSPALGSDGTVYVKAADNNLYALTGTGTLKWKVTVPGTSYSSPTIGSDGTIYLGTTTNLLYAITSAGTVRWKFTADDEIYTTPAIDASGNVFFGTLTGTLYKLSPSGSQIWKASVGDGVTSSPVLATDGTVYFGSYNTNIYALNGSDGSVRWTYATNDQIRASTPALDANGNLYVGSYDGLVYSLSPSGTLNRVFAASDWVRSSPVIAGTTLYFGSTDHKLYAFDIGVGASPSTTGMYMNNAQRTGASLAAGLTFTLQPLDTRITNGSPLGLYAVVSGANPISFQWYLNGAPIAGATNSTYFVASASSLDRGSYTVVATGPQGSVTSLAVTVSY